MESFRCCRVASAPRPEPGKKYRPDAPPSSACIALSTLGSLGISLKPADPNGNTVCARDDQTNIAIPPNTPASRICLVEIMMVAPLSVAHYATARRKLQTE